MSDDTNVESVIAVAVARHCFDGIRTTADAKAASEAIAALRSAGYVLVERALVVEAADYLGGPLCEYQTESGDHGEAILVADLASRLRRAAAPGNGEG